MKIFKIVLILVYLAVGVVGIFIYSGLYPIGADDPHYDSVYWLLETTRENSVESASSDISVPNLESPDMLLSGGADYNDMCSSCHLKPGQKSSDLSLGLYPKPPNLASEEHEEEHEDAKEQAREQFWTIKHGIKASGMPAWGITHDDERIWAMVAFLQKLPELTPEEYQIITSRE